MNTLDRYIAGEVIKGSLIAVLVLLALLNFFTFADELGDVGEGNYNLARVFEYLALTSPRDIYELMPSAALIGALVALGGLANNRELVAMQAAGASRIRIVLAALSGGLVLVGISVAVSEFVAPETDRSAQFLKATALKKQVASRTRYGFWVRDGNMFINVREIRHQELLANINIYELGEGQTLRSATHAGYAQFDGSHWNLGKIKESRFGPEGVTPDFKPSADWSSILDPELLNAFVIRPENLSTVDLANYIDYLKKNSQQSHAVEIAFWNRIANPVITLIMLLVALPFVLVVRREVGTGQRIVVGVVIGLGFYLFNRVFGHFGLLYEMHPMFAALFPAAIALLGALLGFMRVRAA